MATTTISVNGWVATLPVLPKRTKNEKAKLPSPTEGTKLSPASSLVATATSKQIREANRLMITDGWCYLRLFANKYRWQIAPVLKANPTVDELLQFISLNAVARRRDPFVCVRRTGPFRSHVFRSRYAGQYLAELRRLAGPMPVTVGAGNASSADDVEMVDISLMPLVKTSGTIEELPEETISLGSTTLLVEFSRIANDARTDLEKAHAAKFPKDVIRAIETRYNNLVLELNKEGGFVDGD